jgi:TolB protein
LSLNFHCFDKVYKLETNGYMVETWPCYCRDIKAVAGGIEMKRKIAVALTALMCAGALAACAPEKPADRTIINKEDKQIVVMDNRQQERENEIALDKITSIEDIRTLDWINEDTLLIMKDNTNMPKYQGETSMLYPKNLYEYNINTKEEKMIAESQYNMSNAVLSMDKKHIFYKEGYGEVLTGYILNRQTGKKVQITEPDSVNSYEGRWVDNHTVTLATFPTSMIILADTEGKIIVLDRAAGRMLNNTAKLGDRMYYTSLDGKLYMQDVSGDDKKLLMENVVWLIPSPDRTRLAIVKKTAETERTLFITDLEGKELLKLSKATQIYGVNWSPDGGRVAYVTMEPSGNSGGLFVADTQKGSILQLSVDIHDAADPLRWSPSGKQIAVTTGAFENEVYQFTANILKLK